LPNKSASALNRKPPISEPLNGWPDNPKVIVKLTSEKGKFKTENKDMAIVKVLTDQGVCQASGNLVEGIEVNL